MYFYFSIKKISLFKTLEITNSLWILPFLKCFKDTNTRQKQKMMNTFCPRSLPWWIVFINIFSFFKINYRYILLFVNFFCLTFLDYFDNHCCAFTLILSKSFSSVLKIFVLHIRTQLLILVLVHVSTIDWSQKWRLDFSTAKKSHCSTSFLCEDCDLICCLNMCTAEWITRITFTNL